MTELNRWETLTCPCGNSEFYDVFTLKRRAGHGMSKDNLGQRCTQCQKLVDVAAMLRQMHVEEQRRKLQALEQELAAEGAPTSPESSHA